MLTVKEWRRAKGLSIVKVAESLDVSPTTWTSWENDPEKIPVGKMDKFCQLIGVNIEQVIFLPETTQNVDI